MHRMWFRIFPRTAGRTPTSYSLGSSGLFCQHQLSCYLLASRFEVTMVSSSDIPLSNALINFLELTGQTHVEIFTEGRNFPRVSPQFPSILIHPNSCSTEGVTITINPLQQPPAGPESGTLANCDSRAAPTQEASTQTEPEVPEPSPPVSHSRSIRCPSLMYRPPFVNPGEPYHVIYAGLRVGIYGNWYICRLSSCLAAKLFSSGRTRFVHMWKELPGSTTSPLPPMKMRYRPIPMLITEKNTALS